MQKYALVTGTSGGIGKATALRLLEAGYTVFGCNRRKSEIDHENFYGIVMDISSSESVKAAYTEIAAVTDRLDAIINISGIMFMGALIEEDAERMAQILNVNVVGMCRVNNTFLPMVEKAKGRILNCSSEYGTYATVPFNTFYTTSKHAVESYSDGLRRELRFLGIPVITVRPGAFKTDMEKSTADIFRAITEKSTHYRSILGKMESMLVDGTKNAKDPDVMAQVILRAVTAPKPKRIYSCNHNLGTKLMSHLPAGMVDAIFYGMLK